MLTVGTELSNSSSTTLHTSLLYSSVLSRRHESGSGPEGLKAVELLWR